MTSATKAGIDRIYAVVAGDTLGKIAQTFYGDPQKYPLIAAKNNIAPQSILTIGQRLMIPSLPALPESLEEVQITAQRIPERALPASPGGSFVDPSTAIETVTTTAYVWYKDWRWWAGIGGAAALFWILSSRKRS